MGKKSRTDRIRRQTTGRYRYTRQRWCMLFAVIDAVGQAVFRMGNGLARFFLPGGHHRQAGDPKRILMVQLDHFGDAVITTAILSPLRRRYPNAAIEVLAGPWNREIFEAAPEVDRVFVSRNNRFARGRRLGWPLAVIWWGLWLRRRRYDLAIDVRGEFPLALILWLSGAKQRLGWNCGGGGFLLTHSPTYVPGRPEVQSRLALLAELGIRPQADASPWRPRFVPDAPASRTASQLWKSAVNDRDGEARRVVLHVGAGMSAKEWPVEHWRELLTRILAGGTSQVVLVGSASDRIIARHILGPHRWLEVADWTGQLSIPELAAVLEQADLFIGADSGPAHLAAAVGTRVVALFSGTNCVEQWKPAGPQVTVVRNAVECSPCHRTECPLPDHPCMHGLAPKDVFEAVCQCCPDRDRGPVRSSR